MKGWFFRLYLIAQEGLRESGAMRARPLWKICRWLYRQLRCDAVVSARVRGRRWWLDTRDAFFTQSMILTGTHEEWEAPVFLGGLKPGMTVVDVGAHVGYYAVQAAQRVAPSGRVVAFEPDATNRELLARNIKANGCPNVEVVAAAIGDRQGAGRLSCEVLNRGGHHFVELEGIPHLGVGTECREVPLTTLDASLDALGVSAIDALKIDVEGAEYLVWQGMSRLLAGQCVKSVFIEIWPEALPRFGATLKQFIEQITGAGFRLHVIEEPSGQMRPADAALIRQRSLARGYAQVFLTRGN